MVLDQSTRTNGRGQELFAAAHMPDGFPTPKAVLVWHHGLQEHIGRYDKVFPKFAEAGIAVYAQDAHGHGKSEPKDRKSRAFISKFNFLVDDFLEYAAEVHERYVYLFSLRGKSEMTVPFFVGGQSMGGLVATTAALRDQSKWRGLVLSSALVDVEWTPMLKAQAKVGNLLAAAVPRARIVKAVLPEDLSPDADVVKDYLTDPLNSVGKIRARTSNELLKGFRALQAQEKELSLPIYAHHGTNDHVTSITAVKRLLKTCSSSDTTFKEVEGGYHELLLGPEKDEVANAMIEWILAHSKGAAKL